MKPVYFKLRGRFDFSPHAYEVGRPLVQNMAFADNYFCLKLYEINDAEYEALYTFHQDSFLQSNPGKEEEFFAHVYDIVATRIKYLKQQNPFLSKSASHSELIHKLQAFQQFLNSIDQWNHHKSLETVIAEKEEQILQMKAGMQLLETRLQDLHQYESSEKIRIVEGKLATVIDLFLQIQELTLPDDRKLFRSQTQSPWYKLISKYFNHGENEIPINTARNYFPAQKNVKLIKGSEVQEEDKVFRIISSK